MRRHDAPQTAYQRLLSSGQLSGRQQHELRERYAGLDPFALAQRLERDLRPILKLAT